MGEKKMDEAMAVFKAKVERYPNSANVYDSLAEAYETMGQLELARANYEKTMQLGQKNNDPALATYKTNFERVAEQLRQKVAAKER
jgi:Tfp pilus assembly protein PilF